MSNSRTILDAPVLQTSFYRRKLFREAGFWIRSAIARPTKT